jgi:hypothetical protein
MNNMSRPLAGLTIGISISEAQDLAEQGLVPADVNSVTVELCGRLVALGAGVLLGHQWRLGGVMEAVARMARTYQGQFSKPIIDNFLAWPDLAVLSIADREELRPVVLIHERQPPRTSDPEDRRAAALLEMRREMAQTCDASISLSGRLEPPSGASPDWVPGLVEEVAQMLTQSPPRPVYLSRMMGGAASLLVDLVEGSAPKRELPRRGYPYLEQIVELRKVDPIKMWGLAEPELAELFHAHNLDTVIGLTAKGLKRLLQIGLLAPRV